MTEALPYLIVAIEYATTCSGTCPACVLTRDERLSRAAAGHVPSICRALEEAGSAAGKAGTLALGVGRANVLDLPATSVADIGRMVAAARSAFRHGELVVEVSTSLVGKIGLQIERAEALLRAAEEWACDLRFVVVANTALGSKKYWANLDMFLGRMTALRGGDADGNGDIVQLALAIGSLPDPDALAGRLARYRSPVNLVWSPAFDSDAATEEGLLKLEAWLDRWYRVTAGNGMDSSLVTRLRPTAGMADLGLPEAVIHAQRSGEAVIYVGSDGRVRQGLFSVLAEMDPVRFDPLAGEGEMAGTSARELGRLLRNPACARCDHVMSCVASGSHRSAMIVLRNHPRGTTACPSGLRAAFASASLDAHGSNGRNGHA